MTDSKEKQQRKLADISKRWSVMTQTELYLETREPDPEIAVQEADDRKFHKNSAAYSWNNEPASHLSEIMNYKGKKGFGVLASGDQPFIFFQLGLSAYLGFDITQVACFWNELKPAAIRNLSRKEFKAFTLGNNSGYSDEPEKTVSVVRTVAFYDGLRDHLTDYAKNFFDKIIEKGSNRNCIASLLKDGCYFRGDFFGYRGNEVPYLQDDKTYAKLQKSLEKAPYKMIWQDLNGAIDMVPNEKFDMIFISNILDRWSNFGGDFKDIILHMKARLKQDKDARIIGNYQCGYSVSDSINEIVKGTGMVFTPHCGDKHGLHAYWTLKHDK